MLDRKTESMLQAAISLTARDLEFLRGNSAAYAAEPEQAITEQTSAATPSATTTTMEEIPTPGSAGMSQGEYERRRTRESKVSTTCLGAERARHDWWPIGAELVGKIGNEEFTSRVVENPQVKSGRSVLVTSGPAQGNVCITPTRAAIEATERYRDANNLGRGGGVTNGWSFWQPKS